jgi:hypothetical protein
MLTLKHLDRLRKMAIRAREEGRAEDATVLELTLAHLGWPVLFDPVELVAEGEPAWPGPGAPAGIDLGTLPLQWFWSCHCGEIVWRCPLCERQTECFVYHNGPQPDFDLGRSPGGHCFHVTSPRPPAIPPQICQRCRRLIQPPDRDGPCPGPPITASAPASREDPAS